MPDTTLISVRIKQNLRRNAEQVFKEVGITADQAITLFYQQVVLVRGLPFAARIPDEELPMQDETETEPMISYNS